MNIKCIYQNQEATYKGVNENRSMHMIEMQDGSVEYVNYLEQIKFKNER